MTSSQQGGIGLRAEGVGKRYELRHVRQSTTVPEALSRLALSTRSRMARKKSPRRDFWALRDVSFDLLAGEALGLVGRNGAGKSTLLKIASRITLPTTGRVVAFGRVATLLEVGTGFHPELSGRENIFLNGSILGMRRAEIGRKLDPIVEFAGIGAFLDQPVKHYSSGMHVRLAFSVAAHLESDVLLVDEVLAVGDADFQRKCLGKMHDVAGEGRSVIFVSHNLNAVQRLCDRALLLDSGRLVMDGAPGDVVTRYLEQWGPAQSGGTAVVRDEVPRFGKGQARVRQIALAGLDGRDLTAVHLGQPVRVSLVVEALEPIPQTVFEIGVSSAEGQRVVTVQNIDGDSAPVALSEGLHLITAELNMTLLPGEYALDLGIHRRSGVTLDYLEQALRFTALNVAETGDDHYPWPAVRGYVRADSQWAAVQPVDGGQALAAHESPTGGRS